MKRRLKRLLLVALLGFAPAAAAAPCLPGSLADYIALASGCEIGSTTFAGFASLADLPAGATPILSTAITVTPAGSPATPGLTFGLNAQASASDILSVLINFQVLAGLGSSVSGASASMAGASATGDGVSLLIEDLCFGGVFSTLPSGCGGTGTGALILFADAADSLLSDSIAFGAVTLIDVAVNFIIDGGPAGTASLDSGTVLFLTNATPTVPEPSTLALFAVLALAPLVRRFGPVRGR